jgi:hypothetical protein
MKKIPLFVTKQQTNLEEKKNKHCLDSIYVALFWLSIVVLKFYFLDAYCFGSVYTWEPKYTYSTSHVCSLMVEIIKQIQLWSLGVYICACGERERERERERIKIIKCAIYYFILLHSIISNMDAKCTWFKNLSYIRFGISEKLEFVNWLFILPLKINSLLILDQKMFVPNLVPKTQSKYHSQIKHHMLY